MQIEDGQVVTIEYVLKDVAGKVLESSSEGGAISFRCFLHSSPLEVNSPSPARS